MTPQQIADYAMSSFERRGVPAESIDNCVARVFVSGVDIDVPIKNIYIQGASLLKYGDGLFDLYFETCTFGVIRAALEKHNLTPFD